MIRKDELQRLFDQLGETEKRSAYDFMCYLLERQIDSEALSDEEKRQLKGAKEALSKGESDQFVSLEEAKRELGL